MPTKKQIQEAKKDKAQVALYLACIDGDLVKVTEAVKDGADVNKGMITAPGKRDSPLFLSVQYKHKDIVDYLLSKGALVNVINGVNDATALYLSCQNGSLEILKALVDAGANLNVKTRGFTPLFVAVQLHYNQIVEYLISKGVNLEEASGTNNNTVLFKACTDGALDIVKMLVDAGANMNTKTLDGYTPLIVAVHFKHQPIVEYLITKGVNLDEKNGPADHTALHKACAVGFLEIVKALVNAGADINIIDKYGKTALDLAILDNRQPVVEYFESLKGPLPAWPGFTQSDISKFDTIFETEAPPGQVPPAANYACCPVCLKFVERSDACMYMTHNCTSSNGYYHTELYNKYKNPEGLIYWCTICGRICFGHRHYPQTAWNAPKPELLPSGDPFENDCKKTNGGGGIEEKLARFRMLRNTALDLQTALDAGETYTVRYAMDELVQQCWSVVPGAITKRIMTQKKWNRPTTNFRPNATFQAQSYLKNDSSAYEVPRVLKPGDANFGQNAYTFDDTEPVIQFKHKKTDGTMYAHPFISKETLLDFIGSSGPEGKCFAPECGGHLWPSEVIQALENPILAATEEEKEKAQKYKERIHGPPQTAGSRKTQRRRIQY